MKAGRRRSWFLAALCLLAALPAAAAPEPPSQSFFGPWLSSFLESLFGAQEDLEHGPVLPPGGTPARSPEDEPELGPVLPPGGAPARSLADEPEHSPYLPPGGEPVRTPEAEPEHSPVLPPGG